MRYFSSDLKIDSPVMCSDTECLEMLIVLHICSFPLSNNSSYMSPGDNDNIHLFNQSGEMYCELFLGKFDF